MSDENDLIDEKICPYCRSSDDCEHLLLVVDTTFRVAEGGILMEAFNEHWQAILDDVDDDFDEREPFDNLLDEVDSLADFEMNYDHEGGPGMSSSYLFYYVISNEKASAALIKFQLYEQ